MDRYSNEYGNHDDVPRTPISADELQRAALISERISSMNTQPRAVGLHHLRQRETSSSSSDFPSGEREPRQYIHTQGNMLVTRMEFPDSPMTPRSPSRAPVTPTSDAVLRAARGMSGMSSSSSVSNTSSTQKPAPSLWSTLTSRVMFTKKQSKELFDEERFSLPTLESSGSVEAIIPTRRQLRSSTMDDSLDTIDGHPHLRPMLNRTIESDEYDVYFASESPMAPAPRASLKPGQPRSVVSEPRTSTRPHVLTEVGDSFIGLPVYHKDDPRGAHFKTRASAFAAPTLIGHSIDAAPHVTIEETQKYTFAIVLRHTEEIYGLLRRRFPSKSAASIRRDLDHQVSQMQQKAVRRLIQAGLGVVVLENDIYDGGDRDEVQAARNICILVDAKKDRSLLMHEFKREMDELAIQQGNGTGRMAEESLESIREMCFSPALEMQLTHNIIQNAFKDYDKEDWLVDVNRELTVKDLIKECFPLHDRQFNKKFFAEYRKNTFDMSLHKVATGNSDRWAVEELRLHFGERVAFLFAFMHIYTKHLVPITILGVGYYLSFRFLQGPVWRQYLQGLAVIGFGVAVFWGPSFLVCWERETRILVEKWNLSKYKNTVYEKNDYNPSFQYMWVKNELTKEMEKVPKQRRNHLIQATMLFYVLLSALIQCVCLVPFIQWYVYAKNAPQCSSCRVLSTNPDYECTWFITCFESENSALGTDRWIYILIQGIALGLLIDIIFFEIFNWVSEKFVKWENYAKKSDYENRLIHRRFVFVWSNWFFWFLFIAFVYLPFGDRFLIYFHEVGLGALAPYDWDPTTLTLDTLFVTPLVVTQFLNMLLETLVPYWIRKLRGRPVTCRRAAPIAWLAGKIKRRFQEKMPEDGPRQSRYMTAKRLVELVKQKTGFTVPVMDSSDDGNHYTAYEVIAESKLPVFDPMLDYLDACIQFSYVIMFTVVWPLLPFPAFFNNLLEVRGDAFRLLFAQRRPMPRRDTSIGEWVTVLSYANIIGITVVMGFIVVYQYGYFYTNCNYVFDDGNMVPFGTISNETLHDITTCHNRSGSFEWMMFQIILFVFLEHIGFCFRYLVIQVEKTPSVIRSSGYMRLKQIQQLTSARAARSSQFEYIQKLKKVFDKYDAELDGHLREPELVAFLAEWICKHPTELLPYSSIIFRYMDKNGLGKVPFSTCCLMLQHVNHDRFFSCLLGLYDPLNGELNHEIRNAHGGLELRRVMSEVSMVSQRNSLCSNISGSNNGELRQRNSSFFYVG